MLLILSKFFRNFQQLIGARGRNGQRNVKHAMFQLLVTPLRYLLRHSLERQTLSKLRVAPSSCTSVLSVGGKERVKQFD